MRKIGILVKKEVRDILRDKKTLIMMVAVPLLLYPLIIIGMSIGFSMFLQSQEDSEHTVAYAESFQAEAEAMEALYRENEEEIDWQLTFVPVKDAELAASDSAAGSAGYDVRMDMTREMDGTLNVSLSYTSTDEGSNGTRRAVEGVLDRYREALLAQELRQAGLGEEALYPVRYSSRDGASVSESFGMDIGGSIGMMLIVTILLGAVYPAIDATAGEKERGTLETLLTLPVTNFQMIFSKFISVSIFTCVTAVLSVLSLGGSVLFLMFGLSDTLAEQFEGFSLAAMLPYVPLLLVTLIATALLVTALCMCFCVFAKSFKEANNYVTPVLLVVMFASMTAMFPSFVLDYRTAMMPIVNVSLMVKQMLSGKLQIPLVLLTMAVNCAYSLLIAWILAKLYDSEAILFSDGLGSFRIFQKRTEIKKGTIPAIGDMAIALVLVLLLVLYAGSAAAVRLGALGGTAVNELIMLFVPLFALWYMKSDIKELFCLKRPKKGTVFGSVVLYLGVYCLMLAVSVILTSVLSQSTSNLEEAFVPIVEAPLPALLLVTAVMPAVCEEALFRGFLFGSLRERLQKPLPAILISGLVFGAFHMSLVKLLPTFMLGALFAYLVLKTGSIYVTVALHFFNNAMSMVELKHPQWLENILPVLFKENLSAAELLGMAAVGAVLTAAGWWLLRRADGKKAVDSPVKRG